MEMKTMPSLLPSAPSCKFLLRFYILMIMSICYHVSSSSSSSSSSSLRSETTNLRNIASCFTDHDINNFTLYSSNKAYFDLLNFSLQNLRFSNPSVPKPSAIILPKRKEEISDIVLCCRKWSFDIRIRSGGHSYEGISSSSANTAKDESTSFVVLDMMNLDKISVDLKSEVAWIEGGATLGQTYSAIAEASNVHGFPAGGCPTVGVGGHLSGGGFGFLGRKFGVSADHVLDALLVNAEGQILDRDGMGEDVFWAIRGGGGGNWGIVFAWKIRLVKVPEIVTAFTVARLHDKKQDLADIIQQYQSVAPHLDDEFQIVAYVSSGLLPRSKEMAVIFQGLYQGPRSKAIYILNESFPELRLQTEECEEMSWIESVDYLSDFSGGHGSVSGLKERYFHGKSYFKIKSDYVREPIPKVGIKTLLDILENQPKGNVLLEPYGGFMDSIRSDAIPFPHRKGNLFSIAYTIAWDEMDEMSGKSKDYIDWIRGFYDAMTPYVSSHPRAAYVNYMDLDLGELTEFDNVSSIDFARAPVSPVEMARAWGEKYFQENYERLVMAKTIIDPLNVFKNQQSLPPLSSHDYES